jgi:hypothetical protein
MDSVVCLISVRQESKHYTHNITCLTAIGSDDPGLDPLLVPRKDFEFLTFTDRIEITTLAKHQGWDMEPFPNAFPTSLERELWAKAVQTADQLTAEERHSVLRQAGPAAQVANVFKVSGLTPEELQNRALTSPSQ